MKKNRANRDSEIGNTKQISQAINWVFTWNNYSKDDIKSIINIPETIAPIIVFQEEVGELNGTPHLQGYLKFKKKNRPTALKLSKKIHWEICRSPAHSLEYSRKKETRVENGLVYVRGVKKKFEINIKLYSWQKNIVKILDKEPDDRSIHWFWEKSGCAGKTTFCKWIILNYKKVILLSGKASDMKNAVVMYNQKNDDYPRIIIINVPRSSQDYLSYTGLEELKDMCFFSGKYEGGMICGPCPHVIVFANSEPEYDAMSADRWKVTKIVPDNLLNIFVNGTES